MAHLDTNLPESVELGATKRIEWRPEIVTTDSGHEVRNQRRSRSKRYYDLSFPPSERDGTAYLAVLAMFDDTMGGVDTFNFVDWTDETGNTVVKVRFDTDLQITGLAIHLDHIDTFTLIEAFDE
jgi:uncharacterized protein (TIGR02217 family)